MFGMKRPKFKSEKKASNSIYLHITAPFIFALFAIAGIDKSLTLGLISDVQARQSTYFALVVSSMVLIYCCYKIFCACSALMSGDFTNEPEAVICLNCHEPFMFEKVNAYKCPRCGGELEDVSGFYDRHPELKTPVNEIESSIDEGKGKEKPKFKAAAEFNVCSRCGVVNDMSGPFCPMCQDDLLGKS